MKRSLYLVLALSVGALTASACGGPCSKNFMNWGKCKKKKAERHQKKVRELREQVTAWKAEAKKSPGGKMSLERAKKLKLLRKGAVVPIATLEQELATALATKFRYITCDDEESKKKGKKKEYVCVFDELRWKRLFYKRCGKAKEPEMRKCAKQTKCSETLKCAPSLD